MQLEWDDSLACGHPLIDAQHRQLLELIVALDSSADVQLEGDAAYSLLGTLSDYVKNHFSDEERWMEEIGYPELAAHREEHARFVDHNLDNARELLCHGSMPKADLVHHLTQWLLTHIKGSDHRIAEWAAAHGRQ
ncbi:bacteriohemerythrin [Motiliproteus sediminis]|uniref:bacteriohemerythrin n=1 Tax=Motiliproteus sediminis TaxID=1468178 RepID=UPI001AEF98AE|nr:hemerythrin family protein [Motiliproteus sediminis]